MPAPSPGHGVSGRQWLGLLLGLAGLALVVWPKMGTGEVTPANLAMAIVALLGITVGTLYQKRFVAPCDVRTASAVQMLAGLAICLPLALCSSPRRWTGTATSSWRWPGRSAC